MKKDKTVEKENYTKTKVKLFLNAFCEERSLTCASFAYYYIPLLMATGNYLDPKTEIDYVKEKESMVVGNQRLIRLFNELTPWERANVFFKLAPLLHTQLLDIARALTAKAREVDATQRVVKDEATEKEKWVDVKTVAAYLGVSKASVYKWTAEEGLPGSRCGKLLRFLLSEVDNWIYDQIEEKEKEK